MLNNKMKFNYLMSLGTVFRGLSRVPDEEVLNLYRNRIIPIGYVEGEKGNVRWRFTDAVAIFQVSH